MILKKLTKFKKEKDKIVLNIMALNIIFMGTQNLLFPH